MNHTPNYSLSQWEAEDKVLRTDFNADNAKIDAAIKAVDPGKADAPALEALAQTLTEKVKADGFYTQEEDVLSYALFPEVATNFFKWRKAKDTGVDTDLASNPNKVYPV